MQPVLGRAGATMPLALALSLALTLARPLALTLTLTLTLTLSRSNCAGCGPRCTVRLMIRDRGAVIVSLSYIDRLMIRDIG